MASEDTEMNIGESDFLLGAGVHDDDDDDENVSLQLRVLGCRVL